MLRLSVWASSQPSWKDAMGHAREDAMRLHLFGSSEVHHWDRETVTALQGVKALLSRMGEMDFPTLTHAVLCLTYDQDKKVE